jgi:hypothetical protein
MRRASLARAGIGGREQDGRVEPEVTMTGIQMNEGASSGVNSARPGEVRSMSASGLRAAVGRPAANGRDVPIVLQKYFAGSIAQH